MATAKWCPVCELTKDESDFQPSMRRSGGRCRPCNSAISTRWREENPEKFERSRRNAHYKRRYGISLDEYDTMFSVQEGRCGICGDPETRMVVDHDHETNKVRGLLCDGCNTGLGMFRDRPDLLLNAAEYLKD